MGRVQDLSHIFTLGVVVDFHEYYYTNISNRTIGTLLILLFQFIQNGQLLSFSVIFNFQGMDLCLLLTFVFRNRYAKCRRIVSMIFYPSCHVI